MKLDVPYYSQFLDVEDREWMPRACGMVCVKMILDFHNVKSPELDAFIKKGNEDGGYGKWGWLHDYFVHLFEEFNLSAKREENMKDTVLIIESLKNKNPVIISAVKYILGQTKFHMVVITGFEEKFGQIAGFYYNDPESTSREAGKNLFVDIETFNKEWRKMAIFSVPKS